MDRPPPRRPRAASGVPAGWRPLVLRRPHTATADSSHPKLRARPDTAAAPTASPSPAPRLPSVVALQLSTSDAAFAEAASLALRYVGHAAASVASVMSVTSAEAAADFRRARLSQRVVGRGLVVRKFLPCCPVPEVLQRGCIPTGLERPSPLGPALHFPDTFGSHPFGDAGTTVLQLVLCDVSLGRCAAGGAVAEDCERDYDSAALFARGAATTVVANRAAVLPTHVVRVVLPTPPAPLPPAPVDTPPLQRALPLLAPLAALPSELGSGGAGPPAGPALRAMVLAQCRDLREALDAAEARLLADIDSMPPDVVLDSSRALVALDALALTRSHLGQRKGGQRRVVYPTSASLCQCVGVYRLLQAMIPRPPLNPPHTQPPYCFHAAVPSRPYDHKATVGLLAERLAGRIAVAEARGPAAVHIQEDHGRSAVLHGWDLELSALRREHRQGLRLLRGIGPLVRMLRHWILRRRAVAARTALAAGRLCATEDAFRASVLEAELEGYRALVAVHVAAVEAAGRRAVEASSVVAAAGVVVGQLLLDEGRARRALLNPRHFTSPAALLLAEAMARRALLRAEHATRLRRSFSGMTRALLAAEERSGRQRCEAAEAQAAAVALPAARGFLEYRQRREVEIEQHGLRGSAGRRFTTERQRLSVAAAASLREAAARTIQRHWEGWRTRAAVRASKAELQRAWVTGEEEDVRQSLAAAWLRAVRGFEGNGTVLVAERIARDHLAAAWATPLLPRVDALLLLQRKAALEEETRARHRLGVGLAHGLPAACAPTPTLAHGRCAEGLALQRCERSVRRALEEAAIAEFRHMCAPLV